MESFSISCSRDFPTWLAATSSAIAISTYQAGKLFLVGVGRDGRITVFERSFPRAMGIGVAANGQSFALATQFSIQRFDNVIVDQRQAEGFDALFAPHASWVTGDVDAHDVGFGHDGRPVFVNTLFSCLAAVSDGHSFRPIWRPSFITSLAPEDRCHLNGLAMDDGQPRFVSAISRSDVAQGWRASVADGGVILDVASNEVVASGLCMPHSPRLHRDRLWVLNSGSGELGFVDLQTGRFQPVTFCPGYARGLALAGDYAVIGLSMARAENSFEQLPLQAALNERGCDPYCGLSVADLASGKMVHWLRIEGVVRELYDVAILPNVQRPSLIGFKSDDVRFVISIED